MGDVILGVFALISGAVIVGFGLKDAHDDSIREQNEYEAFERRRAQRQAQFDAHQQEVAHRVLIETCEAIYIGRWQNANDQ